MKKFTLSYFLFFFGTVLFYVLIENKSLFFELQNIYKIQENIWKPLLYASNYVLCICGLLILLFSKHWIVHILSLLLFFFCFWINLSYKQINNIGITYSDLNILVQNIGFGLGKQSLYQYSSPIFISFLYSLVTVIFIHWIRSEVYKPRFESKFYFISLLGLLGSFLIISNSQGNRISMPSFYKIPSLFAYVQKNDLYVGDRKIPFFNPTSTGFDHIVLIVDESVRGDHLGLNNPVYATTPYLNSIKDSLIHNFGVISSGAICSDYSHILLMTGVKQSMLPDQSNYTRINPTIFQYAKSAGYHTSLIYSPGFEDKPKGYMTHSDFNFIDTRYQTQMLHPDIPFYELDFKSLDYLNETITKNEKSFTYFLKYGAHFHYEESYPENHKIFLPTQKANSFKKRDKTLLTNSYHNAILWTVDSFFENLINNLKDEKVLIIYTSDHGQNIMDFPNIAITHCLKDYAPQVMAAVPLFLMSTDASIVDSLSNKPKSNFATHFQIFPTILEHMGYDSLDIKKEYHSSLNTSDIRDIQPIFFSGDIYGRGGFFTNHFDNTQYTQEGNPKD